MLATPSPAPTVFVTGGSGFLGRHCLSEMVRQGFRVHAVSHRRTYPVNGVNWHNIDLNASGSARALMAALRPTHFLHLAWITTPEFYRFTPENFDWLDASLALVRAFGEHGGQRFVGVGSANEYRADDRPCGEDETPIRPITIYGRCKAALWMGAEAYAQHYGFSAAWGRVFVPYGSGDPQQRLIPSLMTAMSAGEPIDVTDGTQMRDFIYAPDVADLLVRLLGRSDAIGAYNVGTGRGISVRQVIEWIATRFNSHTLVRFGARPKRADEPLSLVADMAKVQRMLDWRATTSIESGLEQLVQEAAASARALSIGRAVGSCAS
jgi:nucleoside-diphosphate-sugar epimerase